MFQSVLPRLQFAFWYPIFQVSIRIQGFDEEIATKVGRISAEAGTHDPWEPQGGEESLKMMFNSCFASGDWDSFEEKTCFGRIKLHFVTWKMLEQSLQQTYSSWIWYYGKISNLQFTDVVVPKILDQKHFTKNLIRKAFCISTSLFFSLFEL